MYISITDQMIADAERADHDIMAHYPVSGGNYTKLERERRFFIGVLGELCFLELLKELRKRAYYAPLWNGKADNGDIDLYLLDGTPINVDVKTAAQPFHKYLMLPKSQLSIHPRSAYIGVRLDIDRRQGEVLGFCYATDLKDATMYNIELPIPTWCRHLDDLRPIQRVFDKIQDGETIIKLPRLQEAV